MVLDRFDKDNDMLIFKNTYDDPESGQPKQFKIERTDPNAPEELYFVHIEVKDIHNLPGQKKREAKKELLSWNSRRSKHFWYDNKKKKILKLCCDIC